MKKKAKEKKRSIANKSVIFSKKGVLVFCQIFFRCGSRDCLRLLRCGITAATAMDHPKLEGFEYVGTSVDIEGTGVMVHTCESGQAHSLDRLK